jgi:HAD superfamily hydrolase (TIGR01490 family)
MREKLALFDVDHTLIKRSTGEYFLAEAYRRRLVPLSMLVSAVGLYFRYFFGKLEWNTSDVVIDGFRGIPRGQFLSVAEAAFAKYRQDALCAKLLSVIAEYKSAAVPVYLASSSVDLFIQPLADYLGVDGLVASELEFVDDIATGGIVNGPAFGEEKLNRARALIRRLGLSGADCAFYSDSVHDLPLLEAVARPVAVNPDRRLKRIARRRGWEIIRFAAKATS